MASLIRKKPAPLLGIDIRSSAVKLLELARHEAGFKVVSYASCPLPAGAVAEKAIVHLKAVGEAIAKLVAASKTKSRHAAIAVSDSAAITRTIAMDAGLNDEEMEQQLMVEAEQHIPYPLDEVALDFEAQGLSSANSDKVDVLLAACKKENVESPVAALELGGITAKVVDIETFVMVRAFNLLNGHKGLAGEGAVAIMELGESGGSLYGFRNGASIYSREHVFSGGHAEDEEELAEQIRRSLQFFFSSGHCRKMDLMVLAGDAASPELAARLRHELDAETIVANPVARMSVGPRVNPSLLQQDAASLMMACGLALRTF